MYGPNFTFLGVPACDLDKPETFKGADVVIVGAPIDSGTSHRSGAKFGPQAIRMGDYLPHDGERPHLALRIDGNNFVVYDPTGILNSVNLSSPPLGACINTFGTININVQGPAAAQMAVYNTIAAPATIGGPFNIDFGPNQYGVVEPFIADVIAGTAIATITY